jgi:hypothetical protein
MNDPLRNFDRDYFEDGFVTGRSCYLNYRWLPELTLKMVFYLVKHLQLSERDQILDFGCAKGYVVKALRILDVPAYGCDISSYAIDNVDSEVRPFCKRLEPGGAMIPFDLPFSWIMTKDVLEHMEEPAVERLLEEARGKADRMFHVIPLGTETGRFIVPEYEMDTSHVLVKPHEWWQRKFASTGWTVDRFCHTLKGVKENWSQRYETGNGFFFLRKEP